MRVQNCLNGAILKSYFKVTCSETEDSEQVYFTKLISLGIYFFREGEDKILIKMV